MVNIEGELNMTGERKRIDIIGGLSPESTVYYYQHLIHEYFERQDNYSYPETIIYSANFQNYITWVLENNWSAVEDDLVRIIDSLAASGADFALISANTPHQVFKPVSERVELPMLSIVDAVVEHAKTLGLKKLGLLGTKVTMVGSFYPETAAKAGIEIMVPDEDDQEIVHGIIFDELSKGNIKLNSKQKYITIIDKLVSKGADGIILGCTEIPLLINQDDVKIPVLDSSKIHVEDALDFALAGE